MKPLETLDMFTDPDGQRFALRRRGDDFSITVDNRDLMISRAHGSEEELARLCCGPVSDRGRPRVLVGGLGMGYTARAALDALPPKAEVVVAEIHHRVVTWNRGWLGHLADQPLDDPRTTLHEGDVFDSLTPGAFDAALLDVDDGPTSTTLRHNRRLYGDHGLDHIQRALRPGGILGVWAVADDPGFVARLNRRGFAARAHHVRSRGKRGARHVIFVARKKPQPTPPSPRGA